jgi:hypothetical protein
LVRSEKPFFSGAHLFLGHPLIFGAGFPGEIGYNVNDKFANKIDRLGDSIHNVPKLLGLPVSQVSCPGAVLAGVRRGAQVVMPL